MRRAGAQRPARIQRWWRARSGADSRPLKQKMLAEADAAKRSGEIGAVLRRHGLYSSHLTAATLEYQKLLRENERLTEQLRKAEIVIDVQKTVAALLAGPGRSRKRRRCNGGTQRTHTGGGRKTSLCGAQRSACFFYLGRPPSASGLAHLSPWGDLSERPCGWAAVSRCNPIGTRVSADGTFSSNRFCSGQFVESAVPDFRTPSFQAVQSSLRAEFPNAPGLI